MPQHFPLFAFIRVYLRLILIGLLLSGMTSVSTAQTWERLPDMPVAVAAPAVSVAGRNVVVTGGVVLGGGATTAIQVMDLDRFSWTLPLKLNTPRYQHAQITLNDGRILVAGGRTRLPAASPEATRSCELIAADLSQIKPTADLPMPIRSPTLHKLPDGRVAAVDYQVLAVFDPANETWTVVCPLLAPRREHASLLLDDGSILIGGGIGQAFFERVDLAAGKSTLLSARLPSGLDDLEMVALPGGRAWVIGGQTLDGQTTDRTWVLSFDADGNSRLEDGPALGLPGGVADHVVVVTPGGVVVSGGESQNGRHDTELSDSFRLDPATLTVQRLPSTEIAHDDAAGFCDGDWAVVLGGQVEASFLGARVPTPIRAVHRVKLGGEIEGR